MASNSKKKILLLYDYFFPAFKAGGPIQSCTNLVRLLHESYNFYILTSNEDLGESQPLEGIKSDTWISFENKAEIFYCSKKFRTLKNYMKLLPAIQPDIVYINGIYSFFFSVYPLLFFKLRKKKPVIIISPRGMLQPGSLSVKPFKKRLFLYLMKLFKLHHNIAWHATTFQEKQDILQVVGQNEKVTVAGNIPNIEHKALQPIIKQKNVLKITTIALISPMKNLLKVIEALQKIKGQVLYDIYGPIKDPGYWASCLEAIKRLPQNITVEYKGIINPHLVTETLKKYHFLVLPSKSENFGHVIFESFIAGRPVIISDKTPWNQLEELKAGWNISPGVEGSLQNALEMALQADQNDYGHLCSGALNVANSFLKNSNFEVIYEELFN